MLDDGGGAMQKKNNTNCFTFIMDWITLFRTINYSCRTAGGAMNRKNFSVLPKTRRAMKKERRSPTRCRLG